MNTVGWLGGALGPVFVGYATTHGSHGSKVENMSHAIAFCGPIYFVGALLLLLGTAIWRRAAPVLSTPA
jgi:hypothetical protein